MDNNEFQELMLASLKTNQEFQGMVLRELHSIHEFQEMARQEFKANHEFQEMARQEFKANREFQEKTRQEFKAIHAELAEHRKEFKSIHEELRLLDERTLETNRIVRGLREDSELVHALLHRMDEADARIDNLALNTASRQSVEKLREDVDKLMAASGM